MKKLLSLFATIFIMTSLFVMTAFAMPFNPNDYTSVNIESELLPPNVKESKVLDTPKQRGSFFSAADVLISDEGNGNIGGFAKAFMEVPVEEVYITIYLDRWDTQASRWRQVTYYDAEFLAADYPDGLEDPSVDVVFKNQQRACYYRLRGVFAAVHDGNLEGFSPATAGIYVE